MSQKLCSDIPKHQNERNPSSKRFISSIDGEDQYKEDSNEKFEPTKKISFGLGKPDGNPKNSSKLTASFSMGLQKKTTVASSAIKPKIGKAAAAFSSDAAEDDDEEMPPEAKMRMKNIGRDTPTSSGPNSFGKGRMGFCDTKKIHDKKVKQIQDQLSDE